MLVDVLLAQQTVAAHGQAVIRRVDDDRLVSVGPGCQFPQDAADLPIHVRDQTVIFGKLVAHDRLCARPWAEALVPTGHVAVIKGMLRGEVGR